MAPHSSTLAWKIPWTEEPGGLQSMGLLRVGHDLVTKPPPPHFAVWVDWVSQVTQSYEASNFSSL